MKYLSKEFFALQVHFAYKMSAIYEVTYKESLFKFTSVYGRLFGLPAVENDDRWQSFINTLPKNQKDQIDYIYEAYIAAEHKRNSPHQKNNTKVTFGCFSYEYEEKNNMFILHFAAADPKGNLSKDRILERIKELTVLTQEMRNQNRDGARVRVTSWILSIVAFTRLFPPDFIKSSTCVHKNLSQTNGLWGQFVDKNLEVKQDLVEKLMKNTNEKKQSVDEYFPLQEMIAETTQEVFFDFYLERGVER